MNLKNMGQGRQRVLSGMRPTGKLHIGHLVGALQNWANLQASYECFYFIADWHALTTDYAQTGGIGESVVDMLIDWLASGLDPARCTIFQQSRVPEHAELFLLLCMITPLSWLERNPTYKEMREELAGKELGTFGFLGYPVLQAADILMYKAHKVPVGIDQLPHLEITREIARRFNHLYTPVFPLPEALLTTSPKLLGIDRRKMSKSFGNAILISDPDNILREKVMAMVTDPKRVRRHDPGTPEICNVYDYHKIFSPAEVVDWSAHGCRTAGIGCVDCKQAMLKHLSARLAPLKDRRQYYLENPGEIMDALEQGNSRARSLAKKTMEEVRSAVKI
ncbi:MAG: tryptophan--tRNA ligase [Thermodesulfobacteriota bacterium]